MFAHKTLCFFLWTTHPPPCRSSKFGNIYINIYSQTLNTERRRGIIYTYASADSSLESNLDKFQIICRRRFHRRLFCLFFDADAEAAAEAEKDAAEDFAAVPKM